MKGSIQRGGGGAWELVARYQRLDWDSAWEPFAEPGVFPSEARVITVGVNWHPNPFVRVMIHYQQASFGEEIMTPRGHMTRSQDAVMGGVQAWF